MKDRHWYWLRAANRMAFATLKRWARLGLWGLALAVLATCASSPEEPEEEAFDDIEFDDGGFVDESQPEGEPLDNDQALSADIDQFQQFDSDDLGETEDDGFAEEAGEDFAELPEDNFGFEGNGGLGEDDVVAADPLADNIAGEGLDDLVEQDTLGLDEDASETAFPNDQELSGNDSFDNDALGAGGGDFAGVADSSDATDSFDAADTFDPADAADSSFVENGELNTNSGFNVQNAQASAGLDTVAAGDEQLVVAQAPVVDARISFVSYAFQRKADRVVVRVVTEGSPEYQYFQQMSAANQPQLVLRFLATDVRPSMRRALDASEFASPVAYVALQEDEVSGHADVVLTLRDAIKPKLYAELGNVQLTFPIPERYRAGLDPTVESSQLAQQLSAADVMPELTDVAEPALDEPLGGLSQLDESDQQLEVLPIDPTDAAFESVPVDAGVDIEPDLAPSAGVESALKSRGQGIGSPGKDLGKGLGAGLGKIETRAKTYQPAVDLGLPKPSLFNPRSHSLAHSVSDSVSDFVSNSAFAKGVHLIDEQVHWGIAQEDLSEFAGEQGDEDFGLGDESLDAGFIEPIAGPDSSGLDGEFGGGIDTGFTEIEGQDVAGDPSSQSDGQPVKLDFRNAPLSAVMRAISEESNINFILPPDIGALPVNLSLTNVPWDDALKAVLETNALSLVELNSNVVRIDRLRTLNEEKLALQQIRESSKRLTPTKVLVMRLSYAKATDLREKIQNLLGASLQSDPRVRVEADERTNSMIVEAIPTDLAKVKATIERLDLETPQVQIAARIVEKSRDYGDEFGISWFGPFNFDQSRGLGFGNTVFPNFITSNYAIDAGGRTRGKAGNFELLIGSLNGVFDVDLFLSMEEKRNAVQILQSNNVVVQDNQEARIEAGEVRDVLARTDDGGNQEFVERRATILLEVTPTITADGAIQMDIGITSNSFQESNPGRRDVRELTTRMLRKNGQTAVIGGLHTKQVDSNKTGIPILSNIPILGALFRSSQTFDKRRELLIMVTPTIVNSTGGNQSVEAATLAAETANINNQAFNNVSNFNSGDDDFGAVDSIDDSNAGFSENGSFAEDTFVEGEGNNFENSVDSGFEDDGSENATLDDALIEDQGVENIADDGESGGNGFELQGFDEGFEEGEGDEITDEGAGELVLDEENALDGLSNDVNANNAIDDESNEQAVF